MNDRMTPLCGNRLRTCCKIDYLTKKSKGLLYDKNGSALIICFQSDFVWKYSSQMA